MIMVYVQMRHMAHTQALVEGVVNGLMTYRMMTVGVVIVIEFV